ncbi:MAG: NTP transferase domain-containing protein [Methanotrichaceae archaeon]
MVMAGGLGSRLKMGEKPMVKLLGQPLISYVLNALDDSSIDHIFVATTPNVHLTKKWVQENTGARVVDTFGKGYVPDMISAVEKAKIEEPVLIIMADLPLLNGKIVDKILKVYENVPEPALSVHIPIEIYRKIGTKPDALFNYQGKLIVPAGVNILDGSQIRFEQDDYHLIVMKIELAVNVNTAKDLEICESILKCDTKIN